jgi:hypothetical protein
MALRVHGAAPLRLARGAWIGGAAPPGACLDVLLVVLQHVERADRSELGLVGAKHGDGD